ncbi:MAG: HEPN domain-containing protein [Candidatus Tectomicrobia bacterium]|nr:HEPN domain-containing protein [Candidatus Tectomicrobia bacterium]
MKPPERFPPDDPREWMNRARGNLARAKVPVPGGYLEDLCFDAQQAGEKAIKALLIARRIDFPYTHDLSHLLALLETHGESIPDAVRQAEELTHYAVHTRYPGFEEPVSESEYQEAIGNAEAVVSWAEKRL